MDDYPRPVRVWYTGELVEQELALGPDLLAVGDTGAALVEPHDLIRIDGASREVTDVDMKPPRWNGVDAETPTCTVRHRSLAESSAEDVALLLEPWAAAPERPEILFTRGGPARLAGVRGTGLLRITDPGPGARSVEGTFEPSTRDDRARIAARSAAGVRMEFVGIIQKGDGGPVRRARMDVEVSALPASGPITLRGVGSLYPLHQPD